MSVPKHLSELGIKDGEWFYASKPKVRAGMRPGFSLKTRVLCCGILATEGYQTECATTMRAGKQIPLTSALISKQLYQVALDFYADAGVQLSDGQKEVQRVSKQHIRRTLVELEQDGIMERRTADGRPLRALTRAELKRLPSGNIRLYFFVRPHPGQREPPPEVAQNGYLDKSILSAKQRSFLRRMLKRFRMRLPREVLIGDYLRAEIEGGLEDYVRAEEVAAEAFKKRLEVAALQQHIEISSVIEPELRASTPEDPPKILDSKSPSSPTPSPSQFEIPSAGMTMNSKEESGCESARSIEAADDFDRVRDAAQLYAAVDVPGIEKMIFDCKEAAKRGGGCTVGEICQTIHLKGPLAPQKRNPFGFLLTVVPVWLADPKNLLELRQPQLPRQAPRAQPHAKETRAQEIDCLKRKIQASEDIAANTNKFGASERANQRALADEAREKLRQLEIDNRE